MPAFSSDTEEQRYRKEHLVLVLRALHRAGLAEGVAGGRFPSRREETDVVSGHCSTRDPIKPDTFWVNSHGRSFARMRISDLVRVDSLTGKVVEGSLPVDASATGIHAPIYRMRGRGPAQKGGSSQGVEAIVHVHGAHSKAFSALGRQLDRVNQDVCGFDGQVALVPFGGAVFDGVEGSRIAQHLGPNTKVALLQNHGPVALGRLSIDEAAWWQINFEMCCKAQLILDAAVGRSGSTLPTSVIAVGEEECESTKIEIGTSEMGWFAMGPYIQDELWEAKGSHLM
ncbi:hypothetical protein P7C73_g5677, partial [Tremellales sp. Uapishka_1]